MTHTSTAIRPEASSSTGALRLACAAAMMLLASARAPGQESAANPHPLEPADTSSPRATLTTFLGGLNQAWELYAARDPDFREPFDKALRCLDLNQVAPRFLEATRVDSALLLKEVLDRLELPPPAEIPGREEVRDGQLARWRLPHTEIDVVLIREGPRAGEFLFSAETVERSREYFERVRDLPYQPHKIGAHYDELRFGAKSRSFGALLARLPPWTKVEIQGQLVWQWITLALLSLLSFLVAALAILLGRRLAASRRRVLAWSGDYLGPFVLISLQWIIPPLAPWHTKLGGPSVRAIGGILAVFVVVGTAWLAIVFFRHAGYVAIRATRSQERPLNQQLIRVICRLVTLVVLVAIVFRGGQAVGVPISALVTGFGVGGLAVALAARTTLENILGGINLFADQPVRIGELCKFGDQTGIVERIGLRSTRVRTPAKAMVSIPNSQFAQMTLENLSRRDRNLLQTRLRIALDTSPVKVESLLAGLRDVLSADKRVAEKPFRVLLRDVGNDALEIEIFLYLLGGNWPEYLAIRGELLLAAMRVVEDAGLRLAAPTRQHEISKT